ncbi:carbon-nitrogen hydrolase family protein [Amycolatopsis sp. FDAARGOS 1241]|uniref:carbon-nitrogen hydrolase family protein n=1 Tax=Amycolatopsis sp. FDAARGOS 1241 TaxID=2778070 RepID=UPI00195098E5|nr:carbon-nitrogen hydrolase family protein [Amycolatopsis sp. FDAARGOS 1241]QRP49894.1 carbon-nitrogen hydrolase family protein [Amycolatopsis sp. FDAARGOS 1241]
MAHVAVAQFAPTEDKTANLAELTRLVGVAADRGAEVVVLPEYSMFTAPAVDERFVASAEDLDGPFVTGLREMARERGVVVVAGVNEAVPGGGKIRNTLVAAGADGELAALYRKIHLYDAFGVRESDFIVAGEITEPPTFKAAGLTFGLQTCYDLRFPEVTRRLADAGAQVVLLPAEWVPGPLKEYHWTTLVKARAIENTVYVAAAGQIAPMGSGSSLIADPMGVVAASLGERPGVAVAEVSADRLEQVRTTNPALALRRFAVVPKETVN